MENLTKKDLIKGEYYYYERGNIEHYIFKYLESSFLSIISKYYKNDSSGDWNVRDCVVLRNANFEEIQWLQSCEEANKFVEKPVIQENTNYEIF